MKRVLTALTAVVGAGLIFAAGTVLADGTARSTASSQASAATGSGSAAAQARDKAQAEDALADAVTKHAEESAKRHKLQVTIRDEPALDDPYAADAYVATSASECSAIMWDEGTEQLGELVVSAPDETGELRMLKPFDLPPTARLLPDGTCEAVMTIDLPYASRYVLGVGIMGRGIKPENAPKPPVVITRGELQSVVVAK